MSSLKIVHVITGLNVGGAEMMLYKLLSHQDKEQFESVVISLIDRGELGDRIAALNIPIYCLGLKSNTFSIVMVYELWQTIKKINPDVIQGWMYHGNLIALFIKLLRYPKVPVVWNVQSSLYSLKYEKITTALVIQLGRILDFHVNSTIYVSEIAKAQHHEFGFDNQKSIVIPNGFNVNSFQPSLQSYKEVRHELGLNHDCLIIGLIARFHPQKDHVTFLKSAHLLLQEKTDTNIAFLLCGTNIDNNNLVLINIIRELELVKNVYLLGERQDIPRLTAALDIATLSSAYGEACPNVIGEAMSCAVPCVVTDIGDSAWLVGETGKVVPPSNPEALADAWRELINLKDGRRNLGQKARQKIVNNLAIDVIVSQYEKLYHQITNMQG
ncbi:glycosyltransferase family 4 protein [Spirulina major]|uniref:glycosyltransferase family 4 protein n=1 Tax=Spirulina major TaxID=270636 RepID=UPI00093341D4|nr:glycosyltransferase [Spirulina major]